MRNTVKAALLSIFFILTMDPLLADSVNGVNYTVYTTDTPITDLDNVDYSQLDMKDSGICSQVSIDELQPNVSWPAAVGYLVRFTGWYRTARGIELCFSLTANNRSRFIVGAGSPLTLEIHQAQGLETRSGCLYMPAGYHPITVEYYVEDLSTTDLEVGSQAPFKPGRELPTKRLFYDNPEANVIQGIYYETFPGDYGDVSLTSLDFNSMVPSKITFGNLFEPREAPDPGDDFIIWFSGLINIHQAGDWTFYLSSGNTSLVYINGSPTPVIHNSGTGSQFGSGTVNLSEGLHEIEVVYQVIDGEYALSLDYAHGSSPPQPVPPTDLYISPPKARSKIYYEAYDVSLTEIANFEEMTPVAMNFEKEISANVPTNLDPNAQDDFALKFVGWVYFSSAGIWEFRLTSDGGSVLNLDDSEIPFITNDNIHHSVTSKTQGAYFTRGFHRVEVFYFKNYSDGVAAKTLGLEIKAPLEGSVMEPIDAYMYGPTYGFGPVVTERLLPYTVFY